MSIGAYELLQRFSAVEIEALISLYPNIAAVPRWLYQQEFYPYFINNIANIQLDTNADDYGEEFDVYFYTVQSRLVLGHATGGVTPQGEIDERVIEALPLVIDYVDQHELLQSAAYPTGMNSLRKVSLITATGYVVYPNGTSGELMAGLEFRWNCIFSKPLTQAYLGG